MKTKINLLNLLVVVSLVLALVGLPVNVQAAATSVAPDLRPTSAGAYSIKALVDNSAAATLKQLPTLGGQLLQDYDSFSLWAVPGTQAASVADSQGLTLQPDFDKIELRDSAINTQVGEPAVPANLRETAGAGLQFWMVQFAGPIKSAWLTQLQDAGLEVVIYMPNNAYVVWGAAPQAKLTALAARNSMIQWTGAYHPAYRLSPALQEVADKGAAGEWVNVTVQFYTTPDTQTSLDSLLKVAGEVQKAPERILGYTNISLQVPADKLIELVNQADVFNVEPWAAPQKFDEVQDQILAGNVISSGGAVVPNSPGYLAWLASKGFPSTPTSYPIVDIVDDGIDLGNASNVVHPDFHELGVLANPDRVIYIGNCTTDASGNGVGGHGNLNAGIVGAYNNLVGVPHVDANGYRIGLGVSPYGRVAGTKIFNNAGSYSVVNCGNTDQGVVAASYNSGAQFTSNSWGAPVGGAYDSSSQAYDQLTRDASSTTGGNQEMLHVFSAGNSGSSANTIGSPGTGKNVLTVAATENVRDQGVIDGCGESAANNADDMATFSSRGPTDDGRYKPEISAPGTHVQGPASQDPGFDGTGVCGGSPNPPNKYYPAGQTLYTWSSGTSHSAPAIAGTASLVWNYYGRVLKLGATPSPAMLKALLLNSTRYLNGVSTGDTLPSNSQGWGGANLGTMFDGTPRVIVDQSQLFTASGQDQLYYGSIMDPGKPFRVTLAWTDAPGSTTGNSYVNNLDLEVTVNGTTYKGNVFSGPNSIVGGTADVRNNAESVFLPAGAGGSYTVRVVATNLAGDGVPGTGTATDQDYALVIYNNSIGPVGTIQGQVRNASNGNPIATAQVSAYSVPTQTYTLPADVNGNYSILLSVGSYTVTGSAYGYLPTTLTGVSVVSGTTTTQNISLTVAATYVISGFVKDSATNDPLLATVNIIGLPFNPPFSSVQTDPATGFYSMSVSGGQSYTLTASALLHTAAAQGVTPVGDTTANFNLVATTQNGGIIGYVRNFYTNAPVPNATVAVAAAGNPSDQTDATGYFEIFNLTPGIYTATATANLYSPVSISNIQVLSSNLAIRTFLLPTSQLNYVPAQLNKTLTFGQIATDTAGLVISNTGVGALTYDLQEQAGGYAPLRPSANAFLVVDRSSATSARAITTALTNLGYTYDYVSNTVFEGYPLATLQQYQAVMYAGNTGTTAASASNVKLMEYLDAGGRLLIADNDLGFFNDGFAFYDTYLQATFGGDDPGADQSLTGEDIMAGADTNVNADLFPDYFTPASAQSTRIFKYTAYSSGAGARIDRNGYKAIYLSFDFVNLGTSAVGDPVETDVMQRALTWLTGGAAYDAIPWITESPITGTLTQSTTQNVQLVWNADVAEITQPGTYTGTLKIDNNDPVAQNTVLPVAMTVLPAATQALLTGVVSTTGVCDVNLAPINGAQVYLQGSGGFTQTLFTNAAGQYGYYVDSAQSPFTVTASYLDHPTTAYSVNVTGGVTATQNFTLRLQKPCISTSPNSLQATAQLGNAAPNQTVFVTSSGALPLDFNVFELPSSLPIGGGPDAFGYTWITSTFNYIPANGSGTALNLTDDSEANVVSPFPIPFYGGSSTNLRVGNNGAILFNATVGDVPLTNLAMAAAPDNFIAPFWDDFDDETGNVYWLVTGTSPNRKLVVEWYSRPHYNGIGAATFEAVFFENGNILYQYLDTDFGNASYNNGVSATSGVRGVGAPNSLEYSFNQAKLTDGLALCFVKPGNAPCDAVDVPWLTVAPTSTVGLTGTPPSSQQLTVGFDSASLPLPGTYTANLLVTHNAPQPAVNIPVTFNVTAPATYGQVNGTVTGLAVCDVPGAPLQGAAVAITGGTVATATTDVNGQYSYYLLGGSAYTLTVSNAGYVSQSAVVTVTQSQTTTTNFDLRLIAPCQLTSAASFSNMQQTNQVTTQTLTITNTGASALNWSILERAENRAETLNPTIVTAGSSAKALSANPNFQTTVYNSAPQQSERPWALINDGDFENATSAWTEVDNTGCTPWIGDWFSIVGIVAYHGSQYFWAGGYCGAANSNSATQSILIPTGSPILSFYYRAARTDADDTTNGSAYVKVNGTQVWSLSMVQANNTTSWVKVTVDLSAYAGQTVSLALGADNVGTGIGNVFFDYLEWNAPACSANALPWVTAVPVSGTIAADSSSNVGIVFDSTGLSSGVYTGALCLNTNDTANPQTLLPVTLTVILPQAQLTIYKVGNGTVDQTPVPPYGVGDVVTLTATPDTNWAFSGWSGDLTGPTNPIAITLTGDKVVTATFVSTCVPVSGADFTYTPTAPKVGKIVTFNGTTLAGTAPITYSWNFGDGSAVGNGSPITHLFPITLTTHSYTVTLTAANACGTAPAVLKSLTVQPQTVYLPLVHK